MIAKKPQPQILTIWRLNLAIAAIVPAFLTSFVLRIGSNAWLAATAAWLGLFLLAYLVFFPLLYKSMSFSLSDDKLVIRSGVISNSTVAVPVEAIQFVSVYRSLFARLFGLSSVNIIMAGGRVTLPGLTAADAQTLAGLLRHHSNGNK